MQKNKINKKVEVLISEVLNIENLPLDASQENMEEWDSIAYLTIIAMLEEKFKLKINQDNINNFGSVQGIVKEIELCNQIKL
jgi:acyl carrier protein|tara:strand:- start:4134 stop:4379 length:246 start_codon:yes stop_codon:yes gene_type:complete